ncbi:hypothetical protein [Roseomonas xinghualingensis]|uniref:hypothetical protein n=1 Tax=Roseomonas xinghualingensis TaxID=2986475 RepID=UPI0021F17CA2|nr:hypothetical protein [Roseomonas sp. SXEYE001]MCV4208387.1 hypothetical protein [Roseomonas sp. SXEYE001]
MTLLLRPVRHAVNNLSMVLTANLDAALPQLPEGERVTKQIARAREAAMDYDHLARGFLALGREEGTRPAPAARMMQELLPLLSLAAAGPVEVRTLGSAVIERRSPDLEGALILAASGAAGLPPGPRPALRLDGARLVVPWALSPEARAALEAVGAKLEPEEEGVAVTLRAG